MLRVSMYMQIMKSSSERNNNFVDAYFVLLYMAEYLKMYRIIANIYDRILAESRVEKMRYRGEIKFGI